MADSSNMALGVAVFALVLLVPALLVHQFFIAPVTVSGTVEAKGMTGMAGDTSRTILSVQDDGVTVDDATYSALFRDAPVRVNASVAERLSRKYRDLSYVVTLRVTSDDPVNGVPRGGSLAYTASREAFNAVTIGQTARFRVARSRLPRIVDVLP